MLFPTLEHLFLFVLRKILGFLLLYCFTWKFFSSLFLEFFFSFSPKNFDIPPNFSCSNYLGTTPFCVTFLVLFLSLLLYLSSRVSGLWAGNQGWALLYICVEKWTHIGGPFFHPNRIVTWFLSLSGAQNEYKTLVHCAIFTQMCDSHKLLC